jgi:Ni/Fe-hydrogenase subunit HybB-like protein
MAHNEFERHSASILTPSFFVLLLLSAIGMGLIVVRYFVGLGPVSNMNDGFPWGIWITYDVATGTAIACGGYAMAILIYIRNRMHYHPMIRAAVLTSMFGYCLAGFSVMVDLGRPWNAYNFFMPSKWQPNSAMFEVALCVMAYSTVLIIEILPSVLETLEQGSWSCHNPIMNLFQYYAGKDYRQKAVRIARWVRPRLDRVLIFFIVLGITLPTMHQSSLGSLMLMSKTKLHPLWHTGFLPLLFLLNCIFIGYSIVILESSLSCYNFKRPFETKELGGISGIIPWLTTIWFAIIFGDLLWRGQLGAIFTSGFNSFFFLLQIGLVGSGSLMLLNKSKRTSLRWLFISAALIALGGALYRFNVYLIGFNPGNGWHYFPSLAEFMVTVGIISLEILGYQVLAKTFSLLPRAHVQEQSRHHVAGIRLSGAGMLNRAGQEREAYTYKHAELPNE